MKVSLIKFLESQGYTIVLIKKNSIIVEKFKHYYVGDSHWSGYSTTEIVLK